SRDIGYSRDSVHRCIMRCRKVGQLHWHHLCEILSGGMD
ncbi:uncharacterized protein METZ01_LOCUS484523, partial [marine metagenome]